MLRPTLPSSKLKAMPARSYIPLGITIEELQIRIGTHVSNFKAGCFLVSVNHLNALCFS